MSEQKTTHKEDSAQTAPEATDASKHKTLDDDVLKSVLVNGKFLTPEAIRQAEEYLLTHSISLYDYLVTQHTISYESLGRALAQYYGVEFADLEIYQPSKENLDLLPPEVGQAYRAVVFKNTETDVAIATDRPKAEGILAELKKYFEPGKKVQICYALPDELSEVLIHYRKPLITRFNQIIKERNRVAPEIIDEIIRDATAYKVSDIHFEPQESIVVIRFRIDGMLHEAGHLPKQYYENVLNRLKVQAHMRIDEHNMSQDGAVRYEIDGKPVNVRISIVPTLDGEKVALRLLAEYSRGLSVKSLGLSQYDRAVFDHQIRRPYGMIITTGPTGSGKTTTLYSLLKLINSPEINITTIEDPVEYKIIGVNQIQVNTNTHLDFVDGLRTIVRQDPDVILVGEIRDNETARLAVNAALTGHLLFSTFHANDSTSAIPRLLDMGVEPFLLASTLNLVIAQRLVRTVHPNCKFSIDVSLDHLKESLPEVSKYFKQDKITLYEGKGCEGCNFTGYHGRTAIFELLNVTAEMRELILKNPSSAEIAELSRKQGGHTLFADGIDKVLSGLTTISEVQRIAEAK